MQDISPYRPTQHLPPSIKRDENPFEEKGTVDLHDYWVATWKYRWMVLGVCLAVLSLAVLFLVMQEPVYTATATVVIGGEMPNVIGVEEPSASRIWSSPEHDYYETQFSLLRSRSLAARVIKELGLEHDPRFKRPSTLLLWVRQSIAGTIKSVVGWMQEFLELSSEPGGQGAAFELGVHPDLIDRYLGMLAIDPVRKSQLVGVSFSSIDPLLSKEVVNAHTTAFIRMSLQTRFELTAEAEQFLKEKLAELKKRVEESEEALTRFRKAYKITSLEKGEDLMVERLKSLNHNLTDARAKRIDLESLYYIVQQGDNRLLSQVVDNHFIRQLKDQIATLEIEAARLATKFKPTYPRLVALQEQINQAKGRLDRELRRIVRTIQADYNAAQAKEDALTKEMEEQKQEALNLQEKVIEYTILEREAESNRTLYENVLKKTKETNLAGEVPISNMQLTDRAEAPVRPDSTRGMLILPLSLIVGLVGGAGLAFVRHYFNNTLKTPEDIEHFLRLPTLGIVPDIRRLNGRGNGFAYAKKSTPPQSLPERPKGQGGELAVSHHPLSLIAESYRVIRTAILFSRPAKPPHSVLITSSQPQEGKTVTSINIAVSLAQLGKPVLLIDADLRNGRCHRVLGLRNGNGLTNVLAGHASVTDLIQKTTVNNLYLLSRGESPPNPTELLGSEKMQQILASLEGTFPFVIIDSAPLLPITDTVLLSTMVDGVVLVARAQDVARHAAHQARERLDYVKAKILGVVLNGVDVYGPEYKEYRQTYTSYYATYTTEKES